jgi:hypothetical protein
VTFLLGSISHEGGQFFIRAPFLYEEWHNEIIEIGSDYFVVRRVWREKELQNIDYKTVIAISAAASIVGV